MNKEVEDYILITTRELYQEGKLDVSTVNPQILGAALGQISFNDAVEHDSTLDPTLRSDPTKTTIASLLKYKQSD
jgi:hypothetical protein